MDWGESGFWIAVGLVGNAAFGLRFIVQWIASEREGRSIVPVAFWYFSVAGGLMLLAYAILDAAGRFIPPAPATGLLALGWILQGVGHYVYEKNSPAFFRNFVHLAVGQLWILAKAIGRA